MLVDNTQTHSIGYNEQLPSKAISLKTKIIVAIALTVLTAIVLVSSLALASMILLPIPMLALPISLSVSAALLILMACRIAKVCYQLNQETEDERLARLKLELRPLITSKISSSKLDEITFNENDPYHLTKLEQMSLAGWSMQALYSKMNAYLAKEPINFPFWMKGKQKAGLKTLGEITEIAKSALSKLPPHPVQTKLYRGSSLTAKVLSTYQLGYFFTTDRFMSTSSIPTIVTKFHQIAKKEDTEPVTFHVTGFSGKNIKAYSLNSDEDEVLFAPGTKFQVVQVVNNNNIPEIDLIEVA